ncbi:LapA family protein [Rhodoblastus sp.]|jgi:uncharacterized integral membrane protein|uniref:LapA family protein n=1 Tax=Rhodoblastus sp. TaxID=1962975 RepID=UPI00262987A6|nr:LapA family protein [Rhodoblastus sp.]
MRTFLKYLILAPLALVFLVFALANRQNVVVSFDPFNGGDISGPQIVLPLFMILIGATMVGVLLGSFATWLRQGRHRKALREARSQVEALRSENEALRSEVRALKSPGNGSTALAPVRAA